jgi:hypothetical protein
MADTPYDHVSRHQPALRDALYNGRAGSGNHHGRHPAPRKEANHLLAEALAHFEVQHYAAANSYAEKLVRLLHKNMVLHTLPKLAPNKYEKLMADEAEKKKEGAK